jgi:hypothetical protein
MQKTVQWQGNNPGEIESFLHKFVVRADQFGEQCHIRGINGLHVVLEPGDSVVLDRGKLGVIRHPKGTPVNDPELTWDGNYLAASKFLEDYKVTLQLVGEDLHLIDRHSRVPVKRGDKLIIRDNHIVVSIAGQDHLN